MGVCTKERKGITAAVLMATPCTNSLGGESGEQKHTPARALSRVNYQWSLPFKTNSMQKAPRPPLLKWGVIRVSLRGQSLAHLVRPRARVRGALHARLLVRVCERVCVNVCGCLCV